MANISGQKKTNTLTEQFINFVTGSTFTICLDVALTIYTVVLAHAAITGHPLPFADLVVMLGLGTVEASLVALIFRVKASKIDSKNQYWMTVTSIVIIAGCVSLNALSGVAIIRETPIERLTNFVSYGTPLVPVVTLILMFLCDAMSNKVQAAIRSAIASNELAAVKSDETAQRHKFEAEKRLAQLLAEKTIAEKDAELLTTVATESLTVREGVMMAYVQGDDFRANQERDAKRQTLALLRNATKSTANSNTPNP